MAVTIAVLGGFRLSEFRPSSPSPAKIAAQIKPKLSPPPLSISTNPANVNLHHLRDLYAICNYSSHRFPTVDAAGRVEPVDAPKLLTALSHSSVVVSAFTKPEFVANQSPTSSETASSVGIGRDWIKKVAPVSAENGVLIGFGRAVSDLGLTASIYDVMVHPALQRRGIGRKIVNRIIRMLINKDIYEIAAVCTDNERQFFGACGFGDCMLGSTTMMYTRSASTYYKNQQMIYAGRRQLLVPPPRELMK